MGRNIQGNRKNLKGLWEPKKGRIAEGLATDLRDYNRGGGIKKSLKGS